MKTHILSQNIKKIEYEDLYQFQVLNVGAGANFNNLISNGIAGMTSVCVFPYFTSSANGGLKPIESHLLILQVALLVH